MPGKNPCCAFVETASNHAESSNRNAEFGAMTILSMIGSNEAATFNRGAEEVHIKLAH
jgi:hypothetical protein